MKNATHNPTPIQRRTHAFISVVAFVAALLLSIATPALADPKPSTIDYEILRREFSEINYTARNFKMNQVLRSPYFRKLMEQPDLSTFLGMIAQRDSYPMVALAGFFGVSEKFHKQKYEAAIKLFAGESFTGLSVYFPALRTFHQIESKKDINHIMALLSNAHIKRQPLIVIIYYLPSKLLDKWFHSDQRKTATAEIQSIVLGAMHDEYTKQEKPPSPQMTEMIQSCEDLPGYPRYIYAAYASTTDNNYAHRLQQVLADESLENISIALLVDKRATYINQNIALETINTSPKRKALITECLERRLKEQSSP